FKKLLEEIHVTWAHLEKKRTRLQNLHQSLLKNSIQCLETASPTLATTLEPPRDDIRMKDYSLRIGLCLGILMLICNAYCVRHAQTLIITYSLDVHILKKYWDRVKSKLRNVTLSNNWRDIIDELVKQNNNNSIRSILRRILVATTVYFIWNERIKRLFDDDQRSSEVVIELIIKHTKLKLMSLKVTESIQVRKVAREWDIVMKGKVK
ncbi:hypothetical protein Tco_0109859, partial [Tanacetum coccineum]